MLRSLYAVWLIHFLFASTAFAVASPVEGNPVFRVVLSAFLGTERMTDEQKLQRFDHLVSILELSFGPKARQTPVRDLKTYQQLRNNPPATAAEAWNEAVKDGLITPLSIEAATPEVLEAILRYEASEMKTFMHFAKSALPQSAGPNLQSAVWELLPNLYLLSDSFKTNLEKGSEDFIQNSFKAAEAARQRGSPTGILSFMMGVAATGLREVGERVVNPLVQQAVFHPQLKAQMQNQALIHLQRFRQWPREQKLGLFQSFHEGLSKALQSQIQTMSKKPAIDQLAKQSTLAEVVRSELLPFYFANLSPTQKSQLVWQVFGTPGFFKKTEVEQAKLVLESLGPVLPHLLRQVAKMSVGRLMPELQAFSDQVRPSSTVTLARLQRKLSEALQKRGWSLVHLDPSPLRVNPLTETFEAIISDGSGEHKVVLQSPRSDVKDTLAEELRLFEKIQQNQLLLQHLSEAGLPETKDLISTLLQLVREEADLSLTAEKQKQAKAVFGKSMTTKAGGRTIQVDVLPATIFSDLSSKELLVQEFSEGMTVDEARNSKDGAAVNAALDAFARQLLQEAISGSGYLWGEPSAANLRIDIKDQGHRIQIKMFNFGSAGWLTTRETKALFLAVAKLPLKEVMKLKDAKSMNPAMIQEKMQQALSAGIPITATTVRLAQSMIHLRELIGPATFEKEMLQLAARNPGLLWAPLGAKLKQSLSQIYSPLLSAFRSSETKSMTCEDLLAR